MFYQYLRGLQFELLALRNTAKLMASSGKIVPIIEPVNDKVVALSRATSELIDAGVPVALVTNPAANRRCSLGDALREPDFDAKTVANPLLRPSFLVLYGTPPAAVTNFFSRYKRREICVIHAEAPADPATERAIVTAIGGHSAVVTNVFEDRTPQNYRTSIPKGPRILLRDGFRRQSSNALYGADEFFSDTFLTYRKAGYDGCGDYSTIGDHFTIGGSSPYAIVIHLTYQRPDKTLWIRHFLSDTNNTKADPGGKFLESAKKIKAYAKANPAVGSTAACKELIANYDAKHFHGLGKLKELSMRHHIETMATII